MTTAAQSIPIGKAAERTGLSVHALRFYERQGLLAILRQHQQRITAQMATLTACLELITCKVGLYENSLANGSTDPIWAPPDSPATAAPGTGPVGR